MASLIRGVLKWGSKDLPPARFPTDEVVQGHVLDDTATNREIGMTWTLRFEDVLDADKLHGALARLLEIGNWRKIGGRLKLDVGIPHPMLRAYTPC